MGYYFEIWLRDFIKDYFREISSRDPDFYHPHITIVRPFKIKEEYSSEKIVMSKVVNFCREIRAPIPFIIDGLSSFGDNSWHAPVYENGRLRRFNNDIEGLIKKDVIFSEELDYLKIFHVDIDDKKPEVSPHLIKDYMLRMTCVGEDKKILFSYDFVTGKVLSREESLNERKWLETKTIFEDNKKIYGAA